MKRSTHTRLGQILVERGLITREQLEAALPLVDEWGSRLGEVLIGQGLIHSRQLYEALAEHHGLEFVDLMARPGNPALLDVELQHEYVFHDAIPIRREKRGRTVVATTDPSEEFHAWARQRWPKGYRVVVTSRFDVLWSLQVAFTEEDSEDARDGLWHRFPERSAKVLLTSAQKRHVLLVASLLVLSLVLSPLHTLIALNAVVHFVYLATFVFRLALIWHGADRTLDVKVTRAEVDALEDADLPVYTIIVPMYREPEVLPILADALRKMDYPRSKLDIKLALEADDDLTIDEAKRLGLESTFEIIRTPPSEPRTKPKACNYALRFARGEYVTIYDAEDQPEPDQLKKAIAAFRKAPERVACLQARLNYYNRNENWLTRMFTLEYSQWFDFLLPGLDRLGIPIPLGGTSNHFKTNVLRELGAWDPYNVTEDADLGVRMNQVGYQVSVFNSTTFEEANTHFGNWIRQRSRWIKGYMQTWLVHMRDPVHLYRTVGPLGFLGFHLFIGAPCLVFLMNPILWLCFALYLLGQAQWLPMYFPPPVLVAALLNLLIGNFFHVYFGVVSAFKRRWYELWPFGFLNPFYWMLHSIAAYKALGQLILRPHYWEKTQHGLSAATHEIRRQALEGRAGTPQGTVS